jgi:hypothetical protein
MNAGLKHMLEAIERPIASLQGRLEIKNPRLRLLFSAALFLVLLHALYAHIGIYQRMPERPCSIHASAQCQRASIAQNYCNVDMNFFKPRIQRFVVNDGITGVEFPIVYYTAAILYKCFGFNEVYLKSISLLIVSAGFLLFYLLAQSLVKNHLLSLVATFSAILSPVLLYYSANFMPDTPSLGFILCSWYYFFKYKDSQQSRHFWLFVLFAALGALIKAVSVLCFMVVLCLMVLDWLKLFKNEQAPYLFKHKGKMLLGVLSGMAVVVAWYAYAHWLTVAYGNMSFAMRPMIVTDMESFDQVLHFMRGTWLFQYYSYEAYVLMVCAIVIILLTIRQVNRLLLSITVLYLLGSLSYIYLFLHQFKHHDYYMIAVMPTVFFLLLTLVDIIRKLSLKYSSLVTFAFLVILVFNIKECLVNCKENYFLRFDSKIYWGAGDLRPYHDIAPRLKALGITRKDMFVSAFDNSYSNTLYFIDQPGFTVESMYQHDTIQHALDVPGVRYLIVNDSAKFNKVYPNDFAKNIVLVHRGLIVYKIR